MASFISWLVGTPPQSQAIDPESQNTAALAKRVRELQQQIQQSKIEGHQAAQGHETQIFEERKRQEALKQQIVVLNRQVNDLSGSLQKKEDELRDSQRLQKQSAAQVEAGLKEIRALRDQLNIERGEVQKLSQELQRALVKIDQMATHIQQILANQSQQQTPSGGINWLWNYVCDATYHGLHGFHPEYYYHK